MQKRRQSENCRACRAGARARSAEGSGSEAEGADPATPELKSSRPTEAAGRRSSGSKLGGLKGRGGDQHLSLSQLPRADLLRLQSAPSTSCPPCPQPPPHLTASAYVQLSLHHPFPAAPSCQGQRRFLSRSLVHHHCPPSAVASCLNPNSGVHCYKDDSLQLPRGSRKWISSTAEWLQHGQGAQALCLLPCCLPAAQVPRASTPQLHQGWPPVGPQHDNSSRVLEVV